MPRSVLYLALGFLADAGRRHRQPKQESHTVEEKSILANYMEACPLPPCPLRLILPSHPPSLPSPRISCHISTMPLDTTGQDLALFGQLGG